MYDMNEGIVFKILDYTYKVISNTIVKIKVDLERVNRVLNCKDPDSMHTIDPSLKVKIIPGKRRLLIEKGLVNNNLLYIR